VDLVESWEHVVCELHLGDRSHALCCGAYGEADQALLTQWGVEDALGAKVCGEVHSAPEYAAKLDVFTEYEDAFVGLQGMAKGFVHGGVEVDAFCLPFADVLWKLGIRECGLGCVVEERCRIVLERDVQSCTCCCGRVLFGVGFGLASRVK
jgi:hypothetical protein